MKRRPRPPQRPQSRYPDDFADRPSSDRSDRPVDRPSANKSSIAGFLNYTTTAALAAVFILGIGIGILFSSGTTSDVGNVATRYDIDRSAPNPEICVKYGASAVTVDLRAFMTLNPFSVFITQPKMLPGCVLRSSNWEVLQSRNLLSSQDMNQCRRRMNTFAYTGDITSAENKPRIDCVYQNDAAGNLFLPQTGDGGTPPEVNQFQ